MKKEMKKLMDKIPDQIEQALKEPTKFLACRYQIDNLVWKVLVKHNETGSIDIKIKSRN